MKKIFFLTLLAFSFAMLAPEAEATQGHAVGPAKAAPHATKKHRKHSKHQRQTARHHGKVALGNSPFVA